MATLSEQMEVLARRFSLVTIERGLAYAREGRVLVLSPSACAEGRTRIAAIVRGAGDRRYEVKLDARHEGARLVEVEGRCSCPVARGCKHMVATVVRFCEMQERPAVVRVATSQMVLGGTLRGWLDDATLAAGEMRRVGDAPVVSRCELLLYLLHWKLQGGVRSVLVTVLKAARLDNGDFERAVRWWPARLDPSRLPRFVDRFDVGVLEGLSLLGRTGISDHALCGRRGALVLPDLLATGRCHWQTIESPPLQLDGSRGGYAEWSMDEQAVQHLSLRVEPATSVVIPLEPPWYIDPGSCAAGPVETSFVPALAALVAKRPSCTADESAACWARFRESLPGLPAPRVIEVSETVHESPVAVLTLTSYPASHVQDDMPQHLDVALLSFRYGDRVVDPRDASATVFRVRHERVECVVRDRAAESAAQRRLSDTGLRRLAECYDVHRIRSLFRVDRQQLPLTLGPVSSERWLEWVAVVEPELVAAGWELRRAPGFRFRVAQPKRWVASLQREPAGWIECDLGVEIDGAIVSLQDVIERFSRVSEAEVKRFVEQDAQTMPPFVWRLEDGRALLIPAAWLQGVLRTLAEVSDKRSFARPQKLQLTPLTALDIEPLEAAGIDVRLDDGLKAIQGALRRRANEQTVAAPRALQAELRDYQRRGLDWLQWLRASGLGGVLADDMGLGKTVQALAHVLLEKEQGRLDLPALVVAPTSVLGNWDSEAARFAPSLTRVTLRGPDRNSRFTQIDRCDLVLTTYPLLLRDIGELKTHRFSLVILDEAQYVKNKAARTSRAVRELQSRQWLAMSGTPMENHLGELWAVIDAVCPGLLGDSKSFSRLYRGPIERRHDEHRRRLLERRLAPFMLRRTKQQVAKELPAKTTMVQTVELSGAQRTLYETVRAAAHTKIQDAIGRLGIRRCQLLILEALLRLRQVCCDPALLGTRHATLIEASAKRELLWETLPSMLSEGRRVLLFSSFASMLKRIQLEVQTRGIPHAMLIGETIDRKAEIARFQSGCAQLMLISLKAGGVGLNLTAADTVIHYDPWWNPAAEDQATDRAHRIGQTKPVFVYKLIASGTVEERMLELQTDKRALIQGVVKPSQQRNTFIDAADLEQLLAPIRDST